MTGMRKHVNRLHRYKLIAVKADLLAVTGKARRVATDIDNSLRPKPEHGGNCLGMHSCPWRVGNDHPWGIIVFEGIKHGMEILEINLVKGCVADTVQCRITLRIID